MKKDIYLALAWATVLLVMFIAWPEKSFDQLTSKQKAEIVGRWNNK